MSSDDDFISNGRSLKREASPSDKDSTKRPRQASVDDKPVKAPVIRMEKSIFGVDPSDEFVKEIADWIWFHARNCEHKVEVEAKVGRFVDQDKERANLPVAVETILTNSDGFKFESNMNEAQHKHYNQLLNEITSLPPQNQSSKIHYVHNREVDSFHPTGRGSGRIRVTRDQGKTEVKDMIEKVRVADLAVYSPKRLFDWRISINMEVPHSEFPRQNAIYQRKKDRLSYTQQEMQVDLTQVFSGPGQPPSHELEVEIRRPKFLMEEGFKRERGQSNMYDELIKVFVSNVRLLVRNGV